jgi:hypothetical protein
VGAPAALVWVWGAGVSLWLLIIREGV